MFRCGRFAVYPPRKLLVPQDHQRFKCKTAAENRVLRTPWVNTLRNQYADVMDGIRLYSDLQDAGSKLQVRDSIGKLIRELPDLAKNVDLAQKIQQKYPDSKPG